ncbi:hypothetical protein BX600DRAFT_101610 [Xylariales sp. PMI_506]|nr:hypothetical protein BX600DRAFT_101610 [Xylariales sp. PMI_506]
MLYSSFQPLERLSTRSRSNSPYHSARTASAAPERSKSPCVLNLKPYRPQQFNFLFAICASDLADDLVPPVATTSHAQQDVHRGLARTATWHPSTECYGEYNLEDFKHKEHVVWISDVNPGPGFTERRHTI